MRARWSAAGSAADANRPAGPGDGDPAGDAGFSLLAVRRIIDPVLTVRLALAPGDQPLVAAGDQVVAGSALARRLREPMIRRAGRVGRGERAAVAPRPGQRWAPEPGAGIDPNLAGEYLFELDGRWRVIAGEIADPLEAPVDGIVTSVSGGAGISLATTASGVLGSTVLGGPTRGRLAIAATPGGELRASAIDVGRAGEILVVGARIDAEALTRARAMGVRGVVVGAMPSKERRDFMASEARQRASRQRLPPFAVLVLDGTLRRPISSPVMAILEALEGLDVGIVVDPACLAFEVAGDAPALPVPPTDLVRIRAGALAGAEGRWAGMAGPRRFPGGVWLETGRVELDGGETISVPLGDLERFA